MKRTTVLALVTLVVVATTGSSAIASPTRARTAQAPVTFGVEPAGPSAPDSRPFLSYTVSPSSTLDDHVAVVNYSFSPLTVTLSATDAVNLPDGGFGLLPSHVAPKDAGAWLRIPAAFGRVTIAGRARETDPPKRVIVPIRLVVPDDARPGDHAAGVVAALLSGHSGSSTPRVLLEQRVGTRLYVRVAGPVHAQLAVQRLRASFHPSANPFGAGSTTVRFSLVNSGNVKLGARVRVKVAGLIGPQERAATLTVPLLLPGSRVSETFVVHHVWPAVRDHATVTLEPLKQLGDDDPRLPRATAAVGFWAVPWVLLALVATIVFAVLSGRRIRTRRMTAAATVAAVGLSLSACGSGASATLLPYHDPGRAGSLTLCDAHGLPLTHGSVTDTPVAWSVHSDLAAPKAYSGAGRTATLFAYQPRQGVAPAYWSGIQLTPASVYSDPVHPTVQLTRADDGLDQVTSSYPPRWDGLLQLRVYLGAPREPFDNQRYAALSIRVSGDGRTWRAVDRGTTPCNVGSAVSQTTLQRPPTTPPHQ